MVHDLNKFEITYQHRLEGDDAVLNGLLGSTLGALVAPLDEGGANAYLEALRPLLGAAYPVADDGLTPFEFTRIFIVATKG